MPAVRRYSPTDLPAVYDVCVRTADAGGDARGRYSSDDLVPDLFAGPYVHFEPHLAFVLDDGERAVGYVVGTADTARFVRDYRDRWIPRLADRYPPLGTVPRTPEEHVIALHRDPERMLGPHLEDHPAHLHVDLLPEHQGKGHGRELIHRFLAAAARAGAPAVHVAMVTANTRARGFYDRLGFAPIPVPDPGPLTHLGRRTSPIAEDPSGDSRGCTSRRSSGHRRDPRDTS